MPGAKVKAGPGPDFFENWRAALAGSRALFAYEYPLYSDAHIVGEVSLGPYQLINTIAHVTCVSAVAPALVLRANVHIDPEWPQMDETDTRRYHGGLLSDEIAALVALSTGARFKAGGIMREFIRGDERGRPVADDGYQIPTLLPGRFGRMLPR